MKFLLDENVHRGLVPFLSKLGHDVKISPLGFRNGKVFELSLNEERIIITRDVDFLDSSTFHSSKHFGIVLLRVPPRDLEGQKKIFSKLLDEHPKTEEFKGKVIKLISDEKFVFL
ncbi:MAG: hypothetical protein COY38_01495 [Candidatus Aenigmarchaeota archaeon CG_4_10_14_0_8_um_filter_37_24]|nr:MAG: hypothetical protein COY38_01495 [Candidatus Aenigmarchaeota archaeon CG_4_10_14_0_8_um_filter_37_24]